MGGDSTGTVEEAGDAAMTCEPKSDFFVRPRYFNKAENFDGLTLMNRPEQAHHYCPTCKGYGMWNHQIDVYKGYLDGRHRHSVHICWDCNGSGWVWEDHVHNWTVITLGKNYFSFVCKVCGKEELVDMGD